jgi:hypothetical protein
MNTVQTFAEWIPTCKVCGSTNVTMHADFAKGSSCLLPCGHPAHIVMIRNPALPPLKEAS